MKNAWYESRPLFIFLFAGLSSFMSDNILLKPIATGNETIKNHITINRKVDSEIYSTCMDNENAGQNESDIIGPHFLWVVP